MFSLCWYALVLLVCYRRELSAFLGKPGDRGLAPLGGSAGAGPAMKPGELSVLQQGPDTADGQLMGASRLPLGVEVGSSASVAFVGTDDGHDDQLGLVADVVQELKLIFSELEASGGGKADFLERASGLVEEYGRIAGHPNFGSILSLIRESAPFALSDAELERLFY